jgi:ketosteroid isomerase-like protein
MSDREELLRGLYRAFNARDIDAAVTGMRDDVTWANGMEGGNVHGHAGVREYWTRQWTLIDPRVEPASFETQGDKVIVDVHQFVRGMKGAALFDEMVKHTFTFEGGQVARFEIG